MAFSKTRAQAQLNTIATNVIDVINTSGIDIGNIWLTNITAAQVQAYISVVPTGGATMTSGNAVVWNVGVGPSGFLAISQPLFLASGDKLQASGSLASGLNLYASYVKYN